MASASRSVDNRTFLRDIVKPLPVKASNHELSILPVMHSEKGSYRAATYEMCISPLLTITRRPIGAASRKGLRVERKPDLLRSSKSCQLSDTAFARTDRAAMPMHLVDQFFDALRRGELRDAVPEIEDMPGVVAEIIE